MSDRPPSDMKPFDEATAIVHALDSEAIRKCLAEMKVLRQNGIECVLMYSNSEHSFAVFFAKEQTN